jgi:hypothetical protein
MSTEPEYNFQAWLRKVKITEWLKNTAVITKSGNLTLSKDLFEQHFSLEFLGAEIFIDTNLKVVGIKPSNDIHHYFQFREIGKTKTKCLGVQKLVIHNDIKPTQYPARWSDKYNMVIFTYQTLTPQKEGTT